MAIRLNIPGLGEATFDSASDLLELKKAMDAEKRPAVKPRDTDPVVAVVAKAPEVVTRAPQLFNPGYATNSPIARDGLKSAVALLSTIKKAAPQPVMSEALVTVLGVNHPKGLGGVLARAKQEIAATGYDPDRVFWQQRTPLGREYRGGPDLELALAAVESKDLLNI